MLTGVGKLPETIDWPLHTQPPRPRNFKFLFLFAIIAVILLGGRTAISYWVDLLWFESLGYGEVFWKTRGLEWGVFAGFAVATFMVLLGAFFALKRAHAADAATYIKQGFRGVVFRSVTGTSLMDCVRRVCSGDTWVPPQLVVHEVPRRGSRWHPRARPPHSKGDADRGPDRPRVQES